MGLTLDQIQQDARIMNHTIPLSNHASCEEEAIDLIKKTQPGEYISVINKNNLSEVFIYKRAEIPNYDKCAKWNGTSDVSWYEEDKTEYHILSAEQLAGFNDLVSRGIDFKNKQVFLDVDIDLNGHEWTPIGLRGYISEEKPFHKIKDFKGSFNGCGHIIYGLKNNKKMPTYIFSFFASVVHAKIENIIFLDCDIESITVDMTASVVAYYGKDSIFSNIIVDGSLIASKMGSICFFAHNSVFFKCKNLIKMISNSTNTKKVIAGGICGQLEITDVESDIEKVKIFHKCSNCGTININGSNIESIYAGHIFGGLISENPDLTIIIDRCSISSRAKINYNQQSNVIDAVFYGTCENEDHESNHVIKDVKSDLLSGMIGRVKIESSIEVINITKSNIINNMVIPGSVNTLRSKGNEESFYTIDVDKIHTVDCIYDLKPYFNYIKSVNS